MRKAIRVWSGLLLAALVAPGCAGGSQAGDDAGDAGGDFIEEAVAGMATVIDTAADGRTMIRSNRWPPAGVTVDPAFKYLGARTVDLGGGVAEIHVLADVDVAGELQRFYWIQFEGRKPGTPGQYDYSGLPHELVIDGYRFDAGDRHGAYTQDEVTNEADTRTVGAILAEHGYDFPAPMMRLRMATLDESRRNELLVIYMERLSWSGHAPADFEADEAAWVEAAAGLRERAAGGLGLETKAE